MQRSHVIVALIAASLLSATSVVAQTPLERPGPVFVNPMGQPFRAAPGSRRPPILLWLAHADVDGDERISRGEFVNEAMVFFADTLDANHDRAAVSAESTALWREQAPEMLSARTAPVTVSPPRRRENGALHGAREGEGGPPSGPRRGPPPEPMRQGRITLGAEVEPVMSCDRDFSRRVDASEFQACAERRFFELDVNRDGYFSLYESEQAREMLSAFEERAER
ncbi:MAG: hypothetical protein R3C27_06205 [Hyphomonadaceae bacterium]